ncbi:hypothetical protein [Nocardia speluncae]|nr:hypothetical protein [Nocardia speluncae]
MTANLGQPTDTFQCESDSRRRHTGNTPTSFSARRSGDIARR